MKLEINAEIESKGKVRYLRDETYRFVFKINKFIASDCLLKLRTNKVFEDFNSIDLDILGIKMGDFNSYKTKFKEFGINLEELK